VSALLLVLDTPRLSISLSEVDVDEDVDLVIGVLVIIRWRWITFSELSCAVYASGSSKPLCSSGYWNNRFPETHGRAWLRGASRMMSAIAGNLVMLTVAD